jgi:hypothetical protein
MTDMLLSFLWASTALAITGLLCFAGLRAWRGWLELKRYEIARAHSLPEASGPAPAARIEMADLKERLRKLEAIANGLDL